jgi:hypothetical protein
MGGEPVAADKRRAKALAPEPVFVAVRVRVLPQEWE